MEIKICPCCGGQEFEQETILWQELIDVWQLSKEEVDYINRQQGLKCRQCGANLRSMTLAGAIMSCYEFHGNFERFTSKFKKLKVLELNEAGYLNKHLKEMPNHELASYPEVKMENLPHNNESFDLIVHSDTLEHVDGPVQSLKETLRVLAPGGFTCFTIPLVVGRLSKRPGKNSPSYHGSPGNDEYLVKTEYGSDMWTQLMEAGFEQVRLFSLDYPASVAIIGVKP